MSERSERIIGLSAGMSAVGSTQVFLLPDLGEGLTEAEIVEWRVAVGDLVEIDQTVVEVETAKAVVDVPCPYAGRVVALHGAPGEARPVGQPLITIEPVDAHGAGPAPEPAGHATYREEERAGSGNVLIGYGTGHGPGRRRRARVGATARHTDAGPGGVPGRTDPPARQSDRAGATHGDPAPAQPADRPAGADVAPLVISPLVRRLARERGIDVRVVCGTGPGGMIRRGDIDAALAAQGVPAASGAYTTPAVGGSALAGAASGQLAGPAVPVRDDDGDVVIPLRGMRKTIADKLSRSRREIPEVTIWVDVDATALLETRASINAARPDRPVSILALLARICVSGLRRYPQLNARVDTEREQIVQSGPIHLGIAAQTDRGLLVPVIADAGRLTTWELADALAETTGAARAGSLPPGRLTGGTFTLNNYGVFGVDGSTPIINHPEAALLGVGRIVEKPWVVDGQLAVRKVTQLSLTFDHRVCDGGVAGGFLRHVADCVERPALLIANA